MEQNYELSWPELFTIELEDDKTSRGANPGWFPEEDRQKAGSGAATAATLLSYLSHIRPELNALHPSGSQAQAEVAALMEKLWAYDVPGRRGINTMHMFTTGLRAFAGDRQCVLHIRELDIPRLRLARPTFCQCEAFVRTGLSADCPVALLNISKLKGLPHLERWHWIPIIAMETQGGGPAICTVLINGREHNIDLRLWYQAPRSSGGLVYLSKE